MKVSVIIGTKDRPESLKQTLETLFRQSSRPDEIILIDDGQLDGESFVREIESHGIVPIFQRKDQPGLVRSRNLGARLASGDVFLFLDDDVLLDPGYLEGLLKVYEGDSEKRIAGVEGVLQLKLPFWKKLFLCFFCLDSYRQGRILPSGCSSLVTRLEKPQEVDWLSGCNMSFRRGVFDEFQFDEAFAHNGWGDDRDFSYRVSRRYPLLATPEAKLIHREEPKGRLDPFEFGRLEIRHLDYFFRKNMPQRPLNRFALRWSRLGICLKNVLSGQYRRFQGNVASLMGIMR